jgi:molybdopterin-biosynthesis enzyme MoeA-like protein
MGIEIAGAGLLLGQIVGVTSAFIPGYLAHVGFDRIDKMTAGDNPRRVAAGLAARPRPSPRRNHDRGLGPTVGDIAHPGGATPISTPIGTAPRRAPMTGSA